MPYSGSVGIRTKYLMRLPDEHQQSGSDGNLSETETTSMRHDHERKKAAAKWRVLNSLYVLVPGENRILNIQHSSTITMSLKNFQFQASTSIGEMRIGAYRATS